MDGVPGTTEATQLSVGLRFLGKDGVGFRSPSGQLLDAG